MLYADPGLIRNDVWQVQQVENGNRPPRASDTLFPSFQFGGGAVNYGQVKASLKRCFLKCLLLPFKITYDALTGLISNGDQQRARRAAAQASTSIMHHITTPTNLFLSLGRALAIIHFSLSSGAFFTNQEASLADSDAIQLARELLI